METDLAFVVCPKCGFCSRFRVYKNEHSDVILECSHCGWTGNDELVEWVWVR